MIEIKFRAFEGSAIHYGLPYYDCDGDIAFVNDCGFDCDFDFETLTQYIGLKDIDGCEIFESDICEVMYYTPFGDKTNDFYGRWVVKKWMGQFVLVSGKERLSFIDFANSTSSEYVSNLGTVLEFSESVNVRVIGNEIQNPELLK